MIFILLLFFFNSVWSLENCLQGNDFLQGIKNIISNDQNLPRDEIDYKPFVGSFTNLNPNDDLKNVSYCLTDNACGHFEAYSQKNIPLYLLNCNLFCFINQKSKKFVESKIYSIDYPPKIYLNCGWETCG